MTDDLPLHDQRAALDEIDRRIIDLLAERQRRVAAAWAWKDGRAMPRHDPPREAERARAWAAGARASGLSEEEIDRVRSMIIGADLGDDLAVAALFVRLPVPGRAKTRLASALGDEGAARWYAATAERAWAALRGAAGVIATAWVADAADVPAVRAWLGSDAVAAQPAGDLGARQSMAFTRAFAAGARRVLVVASDAPDLESAHVLAAARALRRADAVIGPASDGGYTVLGLTRPPGPLLEGVPWSTPQVAAWVRGRLERAGARVAELAPLDDVDTPADLAAWKVKAPLDHPLRRALPPGSALER